MARKTMDEAVIYTLVDAAGWAEAVACGAYAGSADDARDGFLHFSTGAQLRGSAAKHRAGQTGLVLVAADVACLGPALRWEAAGSGRQGLFPHLYAPLALACVRSVVPLTLDAQDRHVFPDGIA